MAVADHQTAGRGRLGRTWTAPPGSSLLVSVLLRPGLPADRMHLVTAAVAVAASDALLQVAGFRPGIKWPNDLLVDDRKLAGVLAEVEGDAVIVGIGINVNWPPVLPAELAAIAASANQVAGHDVDREQLLAALLERLGELVDHWDDVSAAYRANCVTLGRHVRVELTHETFVGIAVEVTDEGHLVVELDEGGRLEVAAADVVHLRRI